MLASLTQLLVFVELARSVRVENKDVICNVICWFIEYILIASSVAGRLKRGDSATEKTTINYKTV